MSEPPYDPATSAALAATLRDMIAWPRGVDRFDTRIHVTPKAIATAFAPQSDWGLQHRTATTLVALKIGRRHGNLAHIEY